MVLLFIGLFINMLKRLLVIILVLISLASQAQGGRLKERKNQKVFRHHIHTSWHYKPTKPGKAQSYRREGRQLFTKKHTNNKKFHNKLQKRINRERARKRVRGNAVFYKRKY